MSKQIPPTAEAGEEKQTLKFYFTPREALAGELARKNPLARSSTQQPDVLEALEDRFADVITGVTEYASEQTVFVDKKALVDVCRFLKEEKGYTYFADMGSIDRFTEEDRFEVYYSLVNMQTGKRLRLKVRVDEEDLVVPTVTGVFRAAGWNEREAWDMMGIRFRGHSDLRRMFMPEDFEYYPARKEFPTIGIPGSLPLPPQSNDGELTRDPFARAHGSIPKD
ncbi:MAG: NADH-quinone oxidoreductase subunit C [Rubricoccaceae bacterium]|nr:NADH-quinone oxidoreductase subunit C [Rubricoccaceae bacterium]